MQPMDEKLRSVVRKFSYPVWFVIRDEAVDCPCMEFSTKQGHPGCRKCLGTGKRVRLVRENAAHQMDDISQRGDGLGYSEKAVTGEYYSLRPVEAQPGDIIVDGDDIDMIQQAYSERTNQNDPVYYRFSTTPMKANRKLFMESFKEILRGAGYG